jgi:hypothetical protein
MFQGTIKRLPVMPIEASEIVDAKIWTNGVDEAALGKAARGRRPFFGKWLARLTGMSALGSISQDVVLISRPADG